MERLIVDTDGGVDHAQALSDGLARHAGQTIAGYGGGDNICFVDPLAAAAALDPGIVAGSTRALADLARPTDITGSMTVIDASGRLGTPMVTLVEEGRLDRLVPFYAASISYSPYQFQTQQECRP